MSKLDGLRVALITGASAGIGLEIARLLAARGLERATLWVLEGNARGRGFYGRQGWAPTGHEKRAEYGAASLELLELARSL